MSSALSRRSFLKIAAASATSLVVTRRAHAASREWSTVPNSVVYEQGIFPSPVPLRTPYDLESVGDPTAVFELWSGAAYDTLRRRLVFFGGGHDTYTGNELYAYAVESEGWSRLTNPTSNGDIYATYCPGGVCSGDCHETYVDGNPAARETFGMLVYLPELDALWTAGGALVDGSGCGSQLTWQYSFASGRWTRMTTDPPTGPFVGGTAAFADYDSAGNTLGKLVYAYTTEGGYQFGGYSPTAQQWIFQVDIIPSVGVGEDMCAAIDPDHRVLVAIGSGLLLQFNIDSWTLEYETGVLGDTSHPVIGKRGPGIAWDSHLSRRRLTCWAGGASLWTYDPLRHDWTEIPPAPTNTVIPVANDPMAIYGKFRYIPTKDRFVLMTTARQPIYVYQP